MIQCISWLRNMTIRVVTKMAWQKNPELSFSQEHTKIITTERASIYENHLKTNRKYFNSSKYNKGS